MPVKIAGKEYVMVAERVQEFHASRNGSQVQIETWIAQEDEKYVTFGARVTTPAGTFTGHARSDKASRSIEGQSPLEVAETSAVGRALGFAGFGVVEGIATADEVKAANLRPPPPAPSQAEVNAWATEKKDTPAKAALRKLYALAKEKGMDEAALKGFLQTDSLKALAQHMMGPKGDCEMGHPHGLKDEAEAYRTFLRWLEAAK